MGTRLPLSTISYNTEPFLSEKLNNWVKHHIIQSYMYICHKGEDGDKDHIHVRIEPNKVIDPMCLSDELIEPVCGSDKPLRCRPWRSSKEEDWILYALHDSQYLALKYDSNSKEKLPYKLEDIKHDDMLDIEVAFIRAKSSLEHTTANMARNLYSGAVSPAELVLGGANPHIVNAVVKSLNDSDYVVMAQKLNELQRIIANSGFIVDYQHALLVPMPEDND